MLLIGFSSVKPNSRRMQILITSTAIIHKALPSSTFAWSLAFRLGNPQI